jgi:sodium/bile acid cotransporter 7
MRSLRLTSLLLALVAPLRALAQDQPVPARIAAEYAVWHLQFASVPDVSAADLLAGRGPAGAVLVDVREPAERAVSTLPGAVSREAYLADDARYAGRPVVVYCTIGYRSGLFAAELRAAGVDATNLAGSLLAWTWAGGPLVDPTGAPTRRVHVYGPAWDLVAPGYEATW